jgi:hypothetical protein
VELPEVTWTDVTWPKVTSVTWPEVCSVHARRFPAFISYYSSSTKYSTSTMATGCDVTPKGVPLGVHMHNRKLRNIRPSGAFWPEVTLWDVTRSDRRSRDPQRVFPGWGARMNNRKLHNIRPSGDFPLEVTSSNVTRRDSVGRVRACATGSCAISDQTSQVGLPLENMWARMRDWKCPCGALYDVRVLLSFSSPFTGYLSLSRHFILMGSAFNNYISYKSLLFSDM